MKLWENYSEFSQEMIKVEQSIKKSIKSRQPLVHKAAIQLTEAGGKRLRPALVLLSHYFGKEPNINIDKIAASIEILHMATLVHDDIIDDAKTRRGQATTQAKWGNHVAVFTGDYLLSKAFMTLAQYSTIRDASRVSHIAKNVCEGEIEQFDSRFNPDVTLKQYLWRIKCKTAHLFSFSCWIGASEAKANKKVVSTLKKYGNDLGMAFQISDDILDFVGNESKVGKPLGSDIKNGIFTLPIIYALEKGKNKELLRELLCKKEFSSQDVSHIIDLSIEDGGLEYTQKLLNKYIVRAKKGISNLPKNSYKDLLYDLVEQLAGREY